MAHITFAMSERQISGVFAMTDVKLIKHNKGYGNKILPLHKMRKRNHQVC